MGIWEQLGAVPGRIRTMSNSASTPEGVILEHVVCALCGQDGAPPILQGRDIRRGVPGEFRVVRCKNCGLAYIDPRPTRETIGRYYPPDYSYHRPGPPSLPESIYYRLFRSAPVPPGSRLLDVGCGGGGYLFFLRDRGYRVVGVEPNAEVVRALREQSDLEVHEGELLDVDFPDASFDAITFWQVLEHTHQPLEVLREAHRMLRPGGHVVVALPNFESLARRIFGANWHHIDIPGHLYQFGPRPLTKLMEKSGFDVYRVRQDLIAKEFAPSLGYRLGLRHSLDRVLPNILALPFDLLAWALRRSGLMTAYAKRA